MYCYVLFIIYIFDNKQQYHDMFFFLFSWIFTWYFSRQYTIHFFLITIKYVESEYFSFSDAYIETKI